MRHIGITAVFVLAMGGPSVVSAAEPAHYTIRFPRKYFAHEYRVLRFSPDGRELAVSAGRGVSFIDVEKGEATWKYDGLSPFNMVYSRDGSRLMMIGNNSTQILDLKTRIARNVYAEAPRGHIGLRLEQRNGKLLIAAIHESGPLAEIDQLSVGDELVGIAEGKTGRMKGYIGHTLESTAKALYGPAGTWIRLSYIKRGKVRSSECLVRRGPFRVEAGYPVFYELEPDDSKENLGWCVRNGRHTFEDARTGRNVAMIQSIDVANSGIYALSAQTRRFAILAQRKNDRSMHAIELFDLKTMARTKLIPYSKNGYCDAEFTADGNHLVVGAHDTIEIFDVTAGKFQRRIVLGNAPPRTKTTLRTNARRGGLASAAVQAVRDSFVSGGSSTYHRQRLIESIALSNRNVIAVGSPKGRVSLWNTETERHIHSLPQADKSAPVVDIAFSHNGHWLAYMVGGVVHVVDVRDKLPKRDVPASPFEQVP